MTRLFGMKATNPEVCRVLPWSFTSKSPFMLWPKHDPKQTERSCIDYTSRLCGFSLWHLPGADAECSDTWQCVAEPCEFTVNISSDLSKHMQENGKAGPVNHSQHLWSVLGVSCKCPCWPVVRCRSAYTEVGLWLDMWIISWSFWPGFEQSTLLRQVWINESVEIKCRIVLSITVRR